MSGLATQKVCLLQGLSVLVFYWTLACGTCFGFGALIVYVVFNRLFMIWPLGVLYLTWVYFVDRKTFSRGGRTVEFIRNNPLFKYMRDYFPISLVKTTELDPARNYIFCYHPHGALSDGLAISFGSEALQFSEKFPGIVPHIGVHSYMGWSPIFRDVVMGLGIVSVSHESCKFVLTKQGPGHSVAIVVGGSPEVLTMFPGSYILTLERRRGFIKLALETGSPLVPVFGFGQNDVFNIKQPKIDFLLTYKPGRSNWEKWSKIFLKCATLVMCGRFGVMPYPHPIAVVVGSPIPVEKVENPSEQQINKLHSEYKEKLIELFEQHRDACGVPRETELIIQ